MAFWSGETISKQLKESPDIISDFDEKRIDCNSYTIRMGDSYYTTSEIEADRSVTTKLEEGDTLVIPVGQFAFLLSNETIRIPTHVMGFLSMRTGFKFQGLINVSGFNVDPGYAGRLLFSVFNAGSLPVRISRDENIFKIWFAELDNPATFKIFSKPGITSISNDLIRGSGKEILSLSSLSDKIEELEVKMDKSFAEQKPLLDNLQLIWRTIILGIAVGIIVSIFKVAPGTKPGAFGAQSKVVTPAISALPHEKQRY